MVSLSTITDKRYSCLGDVRPFTHTQQQIKTVHSRDAIVWCIPNDTSTMHRLCVYSTRDGAWEEPYEEGGFSRCNRGVDHVNLLDAKGCFTTKIILKKANFDGLYQNTRRTRYASKACVRCVNTLPVSTYIHIRSTSIYDRHVEWKGRTVWITPAMVTLSFGIGPRISNTRQATRTHCLVRSRFQTSCGYHRRAHLKELQLLWHRHNHLCWRIYVCITFV